VCRTVEATTTYTFMFSTCSVNLTCQCWPHCTVQTFISSRFAGLSERYSCLWI